MMAAMMISPQARRRITAAVRDLQDSQSRGRWGAWAEQAPANQVRADVPHDVAAIALEALIEAERSIDSLLAKETLNEDRQADLLNDLGYIRSITAALRSEGFVR
jgi:hypothetical protein